MLGKMPRSVPPPSQREAPRFAQERARATYDRLLAAAAEVFAERGFEDTQTPEIAGRAGVSVGTFYRYFDDKRAAFIELIRRSLERSYQSVMANLNIETFGATRTAADRRAAVEQVIDILFAHTADSPQLHRVFLGLSLRDEEVAALRDEYEGRSREGLAALLQQVTARERIPDPAAAAEVIQIAAQEVALATVGAHGPPSSKERSQALRAALADMLYRYVFGDDR